MGHDKAVLFETSIIILSLDKVPLLLIKGLTVFQKDLLDAESSLAFSRRYVFFDLLGYFFTRLLHLLLIFF